MKIKKHDQRNILIRQEYFGLLIWSHGLDKYLIPNNLEVEKQLKLILQKKRNGKDWRKGVDPRLQKDLLKMGIDDGAREIDFSIKNRLSVPLDVYFDYTWACNLNCPGCYNRAANRTITMSQQNVRHVLKELYEHGVMRVHLAGGEPTLFPKHLNNYLGTAKRLGIGTSINTNGTNFTDEVCKIIFKNNLVSLTFSIDGHNPRTHDKLRGRGTFQKIVEAVISAVKYKREVNSQTRIQIKTLWTSKTPLSQLKEIVQLSIKLKADVVQFHNPERCIYHKKGFYGEDVDGYYKRALYIKTLREEYGNQIWAWNVWNPVVGCGEIGFTKMKGCVGAQELIAINPDGSIKPCLMNPYNLGNLFTDWNGSLGDFWRNSLKLQKFLKIIHTQDPRCVKCDIYTYCRGGCKVRSLVTHANMIDRDPLCPTDYYLSKKRHDFRPILKKPTPGLNYFRAITVCHSL